MDYVHAANIIKPTQSRINSEKYTFCIIKSLEHLINLKSGHGAYLGMELIIHVIRSRIHLLRQSLQRDKHKSQKAYLQAVSSSS